MDTRAKKIVIVSSIIFIVGSLALLLFYFLTPKLPSTQKSDKTVIIDNYAKYTSHISSDSFGNLGNYLYDFIRDPSKGVYHGEITDGSYSYDSNSWFSKFIVKLKDSDTSWKISLQTTSKGEINGDISVTCNSGACQIPEEKTNAKPTLQSYLPLSAGNYAIAYQKYKHDTISIIYYDSAGAGKTEALEKIKSLGFDPNDYKIEYFYGGH